MWLAEVAVSVWGSVVQKSQARQWPLGKGGSGWEGDWDSQVGKKSGQGHQESEHHPGRMGDELPTADLARKGQGPLNGGDGGPKRDRD